MAKYEVKDGVGIIPEGTTVIEKEDFRRNTELSSIVIPDSVTKIEYEAFEGCTGLKNIEIPNSVTEIGMNAFKNCSMLQSITIPASVTKLDLYFHFEGCSSLTSIVVEEGNPRYDSRNNCNAIIETEDNTLICGCGTTIIPDSVTKIDQNAFGGCTNLEVITIPKSVKVIAGEVFQNCPNLKNIVVAEGNTVYDSRDECNAIIETATNELCYGSIATVIPDSVTEIGHSAFYGRAGLTNIVIPESMSEIGVQAFCECTGLKSILIPDSPIKIGDCAFWGCTSLTDVVIPVSVTDLGENAFVNCRNLKTASVLGPVKILEGTFSGCKALEIVTFGNGIKKIERAFAYDSGTIYNAKEDYYLKTIYVPAKKTDYYKKRLPEKLHSLIVELPAEKKK